MSVISKLNTNVGTRGGICEHAVCHHRDRLVLNLRNLMLVDAAGKEDSSPLSHGGSIEAGSLCKEEVLQLEISSEQFSGIDERKLMRKIDLRVVPVLCIMYLLAFLDRVNIGNAALFGLKGDLGLGGNEYNTALVIVFVPYIVFEIPSNLLLKYLKPHVWLPICSFGFGLVTVLQGLTQNYSGILTTRFFLGLFECGMLPGSFYLTSMWYKRSEAQKRYTFLFSSNSLAGAFGGLLASAIGKMNGIRGLLGWRWVFILEGLLTCVASISFYFIISDFPEDAQCLKDDEKAFIKQRLAEDVGDSKIDDKVTWKRCLGVMKDYKVILAGFMYFGLIVPTYSFVYFSPTIIQNLGHSGVRSQLLSVPPYACGFVVGMVVAAASDYYAHRFIFALGSGFLALSGFIILFIEHQNTSLEYAALFLAASGLYTCMPIVLCWSSMNARGHLDRAVTTGWQIGFGNIGGIIASFAFLVKDAPKYLTGYTLCIAFMCLAIVTIICNFIGVTIENRRSLALNEGASDSTLVIKHCISVAFHVSHSNKDVELEGSQIFRSLNTEH